MEELPDDIRKKIYECYSSVLRYRAARLSVALDHCGLLQAPHCSAKLRRLNLEFRKRLLDFSIGDATAQLLRELVELNRDGLRLGEWLARKKKKYDSDLRIDKLRIFTRVQTDAIELFSWILGRLPMILQSCSIDSLASKSTLAEFTCFEAQSYVSAVLRAESQNGLHLD